MVCCRQVNEERHERALAKLKDGWAAELRRQKEAWAAAERARREAWMEAKTGEVKELTIKGLEVEVRACWGGAAEAAGD